MHGRRCSILLGDLLALVGIAWLTAPLWLLFMYISERIKRNRRDELLERMYYQQRISAQELIDAGVRLPKPSAAGQPVPAAPQKRTPAQSLADAQSRAARVAEAEISGKTLAEIPPAAAYPASNKTVILPQQSAPALPPMPQHPLPNAAPQPYIPFMTPLPQPAEPARPAAVSVPAADTVNPLPESSFDNLNRTEQKEAERPEPVNTPESVTAPEYSEAAHSAEAREPDNVILPEQLSAEQSAPVTVPDEPAFIESPAFTEAPAFTEPAADTLPVRAASGRKPAFSEPEYPAEEYPQSGGITVSAITVMLSVGVLLVITAGLIFARSAWDIMGAGGKLMTLAAGSLVFFGTSALARRVWHLDRTAMAFYAIGSAFLPLSVWAAGYMHLLGDGLSGANNPWVICFALLAFTVISLIAVKIYGRPGWGLASLCGLAAAYMSFVFGVTGDSEIGNAGKLLGAALLALVLAFGCRPIAERFTMPDAIERVLEPFTIGYTCITALAMLSAFAFGDAAMLCAAAILLTAFAFFAPPFTERLGNFNAIPTALLMLFGFSQLMRPLIPTAFTVVTETASHTVYAAFAAFSLIVTAAVLLILLVTKALPENTRTGFSLAAFSCAALSIPVRIPDLLYMPVALPVSALVLTLFWIIGAHKHPSKPVSILIAAQIWMICFDTAFILDGFLGIGTRWFRLMLSGMLLLCCCGFILTKKHRTMVSDILLAGSAFLMSASASWAGGDWHWILWIIAAIAGIAGWGIAIDRKSGSRGRITALVLTWMLGMDAVLIVSMLTKWGGQWSELLGAGVMLLCCTVFVLLKKPRTVFSDLLFTLTAFVLSVSAAWDLDEDWRIVWIAAGLFLAGSWGYVLVRKRRHHSKLMIASQLWMLCMDAAFLTAELVRMSSFWDTYCCGWMHLVPVGLLLLCFGISVTVKRFRTDASDILFAFFAGYLAFAALNGSEQIAGQCICAALLCGFVLLYRQLAIARDTCRPAQYFWAVLSPITLFAAAVMLGDTLLEKVDPAFIMTGWSLISAAIGLVTYFTTKRKFNLVRRLVFGLTVIPPVIAAVFADFLASGELICIQQIAGAGIAFILWLILARHGFKKHSATAFAAGLFLLCEATAYALFYQIFNGTRYLTKQFGTIGFDGFLIAFSWILLLTAPAYLVKKKRICFAGSQPAAFIVRIFACAAAVLLGAAMLGLRHGDYSFWYTVYVLALCAASWLLSEKHHVIIPALTGLSAFAAADTFRYQLDNATDGAAAVVIAVLALLTLLLPFAGMQLRKKESLPRNGRRALVLTAFGGVAAVWPAIAAMRGVVTDLYSENAERWLAFFVPLLLGVFILHFARIAPQPEQRRAVYTAAAALGVIALWMQPAIQTADTYWEGKLHLLPLIGFAILVRVLYGKETGGIFLFAVGVYTMLRLGIGAVMTESGADIITVLVVALVMFIASFYVKQKKWFVLGGITLVILAVYMHMRLTDGSQWWVYLLLAGLALIVTAGSNELLKQRGDSLKSRAGRLMEDWTW